MRTSAPGNDLSRGFTLLELLVVIAIIAFATAGVSFALRDTAAAQLDREALRLAALLESARTESRTTGVAVRWASAPGGFRFEGVADKRFPEQWLADTTQVVGAPALLLGPEPIIAAQSVELTSTLQPQRSVRVATDGLRPFSIATDAPP